MNKQEITKRYFIRLGHIKNYVDNYKPKSKSEISQNLHIDNRLVYHLEIDNIIKFNLENNHFVWNDKIPITNKLAETIGLKVTKSNTAARQKQRVKKKVKVGFFRRIINWLF